MKKIKELSYCRPGSCCPIFSLFRDGESLWLEIQDDFGGKIKIIGNKEELIKTIEELFDNK